MPEAKFVLKEPKSSEKTLVYLFYNFNNQRLKFSTGEKITPKFWNSSKQKAKETSQFPEYSEFNQRLKNIESAVNNSYRRLLNDSKRINPISLKEELIKELKDEVVFAKEVKLIDWISEEIEKMKSDKKEGSIKVYKTMLRHLIDFSIAKKYKLSFDSITLDFYEKFKDYLINDKGLLTNTFSKNIKTLKMFLNIATEKSINTNLAYKGKLFKAPLNNVEHIYLTSEELDRIYQFDFKEKKYLDRVRDLFLIGCHTGLRFSDFTQLKMENLISNGNSFVFNIITKKTNQKVVVPVKAVVKVIWDKYDGVLPRAISNQKMNDYLKEVGMLVGINSIVTIKQKSGNEIRESKHEKYKLITTHTARRSFATNAYLNDIPSISIMQLTGHKTESSFMKYIKVSQEKNADKLINHPFFQ